jgi:hypothetical protein
LDKWQIFRFHVWFSSSAFSYSVDQSAMKKKYQRDAMLQYLDAQTPSGDLALPIAQGHKYQLG